MVASLFVGAVLCVSAEPAAPGMTEAHRDALARFGAGIWNLRRERLLTAAKQLEAAAKQDPDAVEPLRELAKLYAQLGRDPEAIKLARKIIDKDPDDYDTALLLGRLLSNVGETEGALIAVKLACQSKALTERPEKAVRAFRDLAALSEKAQELPTAEAALRKAVGLVTEGRAAVVALAAFTPKEADSEAADCLEQLGHLLVKRRKFASAVEAYTDAAKLFADPKKADDALSAARLNWNLSGALQAQGDATTALKHLEDFLKLRPQAPEPYQRFAKLLRAANRSDDVVPQLRKLAERDEKNRSLVAVLAAEMASDPASRREADELFKALTGLTADPKVIAVMVRAHLDTRRPGEIIADLDRSFVLLEEKKKDKPEAPITAEAKAFAAEKARAIADAFQNDAAGVSALLRAAAEELRAGTKRNHGTYYFLGTLASRHHRLDLAAAQYRQAALRAPKESQVDAYSALIEVLWFAGKPGEVETVCRDGLDSPGIQIAPVFFNYHLARALAEQGKASAAIATADKAILQAADTDRLAVRLGKHRVLRILGQWNDAIDYGKKLTEEFDSPSDRPKVRYAQSGAYWGAKKSTEAEALLRAILDDDADDATACNDLGYHLAEQGRNLDEAERLVRHAIELDRIERRKSGSVESDSAAYRDSLGWVLFRQGKFVDARAELEKALTLFGGDTDATVWDHLGDVLFRLDEKPKAKGAWEKAKELYEADLRPSARGRQDGRLDEVKRKLARIPRE